MLRQIRLTALTCLALLALASAAPAQKAPAAAAAPATSDALAAARELLDLTGSAKMVDQMLPMMMNQMVQSRAAIAPDKRAIIEEVMGKLTVRFSERKGEMIEEIAKLYAAKMTAPEMRQVSAFYRTPTGRKMIALMPEIGKQSMLIGQRWGMSIGRELEAEARKELKKRGVDL